jgi:hypothetical protein
VDAAERNIISGNTANGVTISGAGSTQNLVAGNYIGTNAAGTNALPNANGVILQNGAQANRIGADGHDANPLAEANLISGNTFNGVGLFGASFNIVAGNFIGTDASGAAALGNGQRGILFIGGVQSNNRIGTDGDGVGDAAERNVISGNGFAFGGGWSGVELNGAGTNLNVVAGNYIGTNASGTAALANSGPGVFILSSAQTNRIGTNGDGINDAAEANTIAFNALAGVAVLGSSTTGNSIRGNSIHDNGGLGIDLGGDGVTANDAGDADTGPNNLQNYPVLTAAVPGASTSIAGTLNSLPNTTFTIDFYASAIADPSGYGEGQRYLGSVTVTTDGSGNASFSTTLTAATGMGEVIAATATDPGGNTSEFAAAFTALSVHNGQKATIGFWNNSNGQALIKSFGLTAQGQSLADWLAGSFPNLFGHLAGKGNADVAAYSQFVFRNAFIFNLVASGSDSGMKLEAQVLSTALSVFATTQSLGGTTAAAYGFEVTVAGLGAASYNLGASGSAFGLPSNATVTILQLLQRTDGLTVRKALMNSDPTRYGVVYGGDATQARLWRPIVNAVFDAINNLGDIS